MNRWVAVMVLALGLMASQAFAGESKAISKSEYNADKKVLSITFANGKAYEYAEVPQEVAAEFEKAESKGKAFKKLIKGKYEAKKIEPAPEKKTE